MIITELQKKMDDIRKSYINVDFKIEAIKIASLFLNLQKYNGKEQLVRYDEFQIIEDFLYKEKELIYFINNFIEQLNTLVTNIKFENKNVFIPNSNNTFTYYFDSLITQFSLMIESEQRLQIERYFKEKDNLLFYPNRNEFGLWWEVFMLRNRIVHYTGNRYLDNKLECNCYYPFSSKCMGINITDNNNITINSTLIDIYKDGFIKAKIEESIKTKTNPFDLLFPNKSAKGKNKNNPIINFINKDIWFDYATSGIRLLYEINSFLDDINNLFFKYILKQLDNKNEILNSNIVLLINDEEKTMSIKDLYKKV